MALIRFMELLPELWGIRYILLENVVGFEKSVARDELVQILEENLFQVQEFHLTPSQFHIPNSRSRYYLLAKKKPWAFTHTSLGLVNNYLIASCLSIAQKKMFQTIFNYFTFKIYIYL
jgi:tRNA (cytosine38-C5)-methyltransferase